MDPNEDHLLKEQETSKLAMYLGVAAIGVISFLFGKFIFTLIPVFLAELTRPIFKSDFAQVLIEGFFKLLLLLSYIYFVSLTPLIKRVFQYHGAEHKVINTFESGKELTVENVQCSFSSPLPVRQQFHPIYSCCWGISFICLSPQIHLWFE